MSFIEVVWLCMVRHHFYLACLPLYHNSTTLQPMEMRITKYHGAHIGSQDPHCTLFIKKKILQENWPLSVISFISFNLSLCAYQISFSSKFDKKALVHRFIKMIFLHLLSILSYLDLFSILSCLWQIINIFFLIILKWHCYSIQQWSQTYHILLNNRILSLLWLQLSGYLWLWFQNLHHHCLPGIL